MNPPIHLRTPKRLLARTLARMRRKGYWIAKKPELSNNGRVFFCYFVPLARKTAE